MRYHVISDGRKNIAIVFHDSGNGYLHCKSSKESFLKSFESACSMTSDKFVLDGDVLRLKKRGSFDEDWMKDVMRKLCGIYWKVIESGKMLPGEDSIEEIIKKFMPV